MRRSWRSRETPRCAGRSAVAMAAARRMGLLVACSAGTAPASAAAGSISTGPSGAARRCSWTCSSSSSPSSRKLRCHFHEFMADVHERIGAARRGTDGDPIAAVARLDRRGDRAPVLRRAAGDRHCRRHDPRAAVQAALRARRGRGGDVQCGAARALQGWAQPAAVPALRRADRGAHGGVALDARRRTTASTSSRANRSISRPTMRRRAPSSTATGTG